MSKVTVIVPVYNSEEFLDECIKSILEQSFSDIELLLVDDGSKDRSATICDNYSEQDKRVIVIHKANEGVSSARNTGLDYVLNKSDSNFLCFVDSDDYVRKDYVEKLYNACITNKTLLSQCRHTSIPNFTEKDSDGVSVVTTKSLFTDKSNFCAYPWLRMYSKELFKGISFPIGKIYEDTFTMPKVVLNTDNIAIIENRLYFYRINPNGITKSTWTPKHLDRFEALYDRIAYFKSINFTEALGNIYKELFDSLKTEIRLVRENFSDKYPKELNEMVLMFDTLIKEHGKEFKWYKSDIYYAKELDKHSKKTIVKYALMVLFTEGPVSFVNRVIYFIRGW